MGQNGNGKKTSISISTLIQTKWNGGDPYATISQLLKRNPTGVLTIHVSQGGINGLEWTERSQPLSEQACDTMRKAT